MAENNKKNGNGFGTAMGVGMGIAALAGAYFLYGSKDAPKNRKKVKSWMLKAKGDVLARLEKAKEVNEEKYHQVLADVMTRYEKMKDVDTSELRALWKDLEGHWKHIKKELEASEKSVRKAPKAAKKTVKRAKKATKK